MHSAPRPDRIHYPHPDSSVVVVLPRVGDRILLQLRDDIEGIVFPGYWGFFGGAIDEGENPTQAAIRETAEELNMKPDDLFFVGFEAVQELNGLHAHAFSFLLDRAVDDIELGEGMDKALLGLDDLATGWAYSKAKGRDYPVIPVEFLERCMRRTLKSWGE